MRKPLLRDENGKCLCWIDNEGRFQPSSDVATAITNSFQHHQCTSAPKFNMATAYSVNQWWRVFQRDWAWDPEKHTLDEIYLAWYAKAEARYDDNMNKYHAKGFPPPWISKTTWNSWKRGYWATEKFQKQSEVNRKNRRRNESLHTGGSIPHSEHSRRLAEVLGRDPHSFETFVHTHTHDHDEKQWVDSK